MTNLSSHLVYSAGILLVILGTFRAFAVRASLKTGAGTTAATVKSGVVTPILPETASQMHLSKNFAVFFVGGISMVFSDALVVSSLGATICAGLAIYLGLEVWGKTTRGDNARPLLAIDTLLYLAPAVCYAIAAILWIVI